MQVVVGAVGLVSPALIDNEHTDRRTDRQRYMCWSWYSQDLKVRETGQSLRRNTAQTVAVQTQAAQ
jgi:hypothetical protein